VSAWLKETAEEQKETEREFVDRMIEVLKGVWYGGDEDEYPLDDINVGDLRRLVSALNVRLEDDAWDERFKASNAKKAGKPALRSVKKRRAA
jgi:hypothetical protein